MDQLSRKLLVENKFPTDHGVHYKQGMTAVWSDGDKIIIRNKSGPKWVEVNVDNIFGTGEWKKIEAAKYFDLEYPTSPSSNVKAYECVSGYIPERILIDINSIEDLSDDEKKKAALEALKDV